MQVQLSKLNLLKSERHKYKYALLAEHGIIQTKNYFLLFVYFLDGKRCAVSIILESFNETILGIIFPFLLK